MFVFLSFYYKFLLRMSVFKLVHLPSSFALVIINTATRGHHQTINLKFENKNDVVRSLPSYLAATSIARTQTWMNCQWVVVSCIVGNVGDKEEKG